MSGLEIVCAMGRDAKKSEAAGGERAADIDSRAADGDSPSSYNNEDENQQYATTNLDGVSSGTARNRRNGRAAASRRSNDEALLRGEDDTRALGRSPKTFGDLADYLRQFGSAQFREVIPFIKKELEDTGVDLNTAITFIRAHLNRGSRSGADASLRQQLAQMRELRVAGTTAQVAKTLPEVVVNPVSMDFPQFAKLKVNNRLATLNFPTEKTQEPTTNCPAILVQMHDKKSKGQVDNKQLLYLKSLSAPNQSVDRFLFDTVHTEGYESKDELLSRSFLKQRTVELPNTELQRANPLVDEESATFEEQPSLEFFKLASALALVSSHSITYKDTNSTECFPNYLFHLFELDYFEFTKEVGNQPLLQKWLHEELCKRLMKMKTLLGASKDLAHHEKLLSVGLRMLENTEAVLFGSGEDKVHNDWHDVKLATNGRLEAARPVALRKTNRLSRDDR